MVFLMIGDVGLGRIMQFWLLVMELMRPVGKCFIRLRTVGGRTGVKTGILGFSGRTGKSVGFVGLLRMLVILLWIYNF